jgi:hypothetical protein
MEITPAQEIPRFAPANRNCTFDLLHPGWSSQKTHFRVAQLWELYYSCFARVWRGMEVATSRPPGQNCKVLHQKKKLAYIIVFLFII